MRHPIAIGLCWAVVAFAPGCPKDGKQGAGGTAQDGGSSSSGSQMGTGSGQHGSGGASSHPGTGGSSSSGAGASGSGGGNASSGSSGGGAQDGGAAHDPGNPMTDAGSGTVDGGADAGSGTSVCDLKCGTGTHCELVQVQCIRAPCPPQKNCVKDADSQSCGGFAGLPCPGGGTCLDDPSDSCDPMNGGADCGGICQCDKAASCIKGKHWDGRPSVCACVDDTASGSGQACGKSHTCNPGDVCCNPSCGICTPPNGACPQIACL